MHSTLPTLVLCSISQSLTLGMHPQMYSGTTIMFHARMIMCEPICGWMIRRTVVSQPTRVQILLLVLFLDLFYDFRRYPFSGRRRSRRLRGERLHLYCVLKNPRLCLFDTTFHKFTLRFRNHTNTLFFFVGKPTHFFDITCH